MLISKKKKKILRKYRTCKILADICIQALNYQFGKYSKDVEITDISSTFKFALLFIIINLKIIRIGKKREKQQKNKKRNQLFHRRRKGDRKEDISVDEIMHKGIGHDY